MRHESIAILGGGLAGLSASMVTRAPVFEADSGFGGIARSDTRDGFTFDRGIHVLQTRNARIIQLLEDIGVEVNHHEREAYIHSHRTFTPYPFQVNTAALPIALRAHCVWNYLRRPRDMAVNNYEDWMYANIGRGFAETFLIPYSEKFWTVHPREMTHDWTGSRVPPSSAAKVLRGAFWNRRTAVGTNAEFRYPKSGGYAAICEGLSKRAGPLHPGHRASRIDVKARTVEFGNGAIVRYDKLITTIPLPELVGMSTGVPAEVVAAAARLRTNSIRVVNFGIDRPDLPKWHWVHFPERDIRFFRLSFPHNFADDIAPKGMSAISAEVAYRPGEAPEDGPLVERVRSDLVRVGLLRENDRIVHTSTQDIRYAYCIYDSHRKKSVRTLREWFGANDIVTAGRYGLWSYFWSDESMMSGIQAGERVMRALKGEVEEEPEHTLAAD